MQSANPTPPPTPSLPHIGRHLHSSSQHRRISSGGIVDYAGPSPIASVPGMSQTSAYSAAIHTSLPPLSSKSAGKGGTGDTPAPPAASEDVVRLSASATLCHDFLRDALETLRAGGPGAETVRAVFPDASALEGACAAMRAAAGPLHLPAGADADGERSSGQFGYYGTGGLDEVPCGFDELVGAGAVACNSRVRRSVEEEIVRTSLFEQFLSAVTEKGFFKDAGNPGEPRYEDRFKKVVNKFRAKLAAKAAEQAAQTGSTSVSQRENVHSRARLSPPSTAPKAELAPIPGPPQVQQHHQQQQQQQLHPALSYNEQDLEEAERFKAAGNTFMQNKEYARAVESYSTALRLLPAGPTSHVFYANRAAALLSMKRFRDAAADAERSIALRTDYGKGYARLGLAKFFLEDYDGAMDAYTISLSHDPENASSKAYLAKARAKGGAGRTKNSQRAGRELEADQREAEKLKSAGNSYMSGKEYQRAIEAYTAALKLSPSGPSSHVYFSNRAAALCYLERYEEAELDSERSIGLRPDYGKAHARLGLSRFFLEDYVGASDAYTAALQFDPENAASKSYLAKARAKLVAAEQDEDELMGPVDEDGGAENGLDPYAGMANDPSMMHMAQAMMHNPEMQKHVQTMMQNPEMMQEMMKNMGNTGH